MLLRPGARHIIDSLVGFGVVNISSGSTAVLPFDPHSPAVLLSDNLGAFQNMRGKNTARKQASMTRLGYRREQHESSKLPK